MKESPMNIKRLLTFVLSGSLFVVGVGLLVTGSASGLIGLGMILAGIGIFMFMFAKVRDLHPPAARDGGLDDYIDACVNVSQFDVDA